VQSLARWDFRVSTYNILPCDSVVFIRAQIGTLTELKEMFEKRPYDRDEFGDTLLHVCCKLSFRLLNLIH
jgi:hypothetical protein